LYPAAPQTNFVTWINDFWRWGRDKKMNFGGFIHPWYKEEKSMIIFKIGFTMDFGIISLIPRLGLPHITKIPHRWTLYITQILKLGSQIPLIFSKWCMSIHPYMSIMLVPRDIFDVSFTSKSPTPPFS